MTVDTDKRMLWRLFRSEGFSLFWLLVGGLAIRLYQISPALLELIPNRQIIDAELARGLYQRGFFDLNLHVFGLPLYHWLVASAYTLLGGVDEVVGRLVSVFFSILSAYFFYKLVALFGSKRQALIALFFFFVLSPVHIIISRSFLIDEMTLFLGIASLYFLALWRQQRQLFQFGLSLLCFTLMLLSKFTFGYLLLPVLWLLKPTGKKRLKQSQWRWLIAFVGLTLLPTAGWYLYAKHANELLHGGPTGEWNPVFFFSIKNVFSTTFYVNIFYFLFNYATTFFGLPLVLLGGTIKRHFDRTVIFYLWIVGAMVFIIAFSRSTISHNYYYVAFAAPLAFLAGRGFDWLYDKVILSTFLPRSLWLSSLLLLSLPSVVNQDFLRAYRTEPAYADVPLAARITQNFTSTTDSIITSAFRMEGILYFSGRQGYELRLGPLSSQEATEQLEAYRAEGISYYVLYDKQELATKKEFAAHLQRYRVVFDSPDLATVIYRL